MTGGIGFGRPTGQGDPSPGRSGGMQTGKPPKREPKQTEDDSEAPDEQTDKK
jgi:hypothetical protein